VFDRVLWGEREINNLRVFSASHFSNNLIVVL